MISACYCRSPLSPLAVLLAQYDMGSYCWALCALPQERSDVSLCRVTSYENASVAHSDVNTWFSSLSVMDHSPFCLRSADVKWRPFLAHATWQPSSVNACYPVCVTSGEVKDGQRDLACTSSHGRACMHLPTLCHANVSVVICLFADFCFIWVYYSSPDLQQKVYWCEAR